MEDETKDTTTETQPDEASENLEVSSDVEEAVEEDVAEETQETQTETSEDALLQRINKELGKNFKSLDTALKSWKDTTSYVGKKKEDIVKEETKKPNGDFISREEFLTEIFYRDNAELAEHRDLIDSVAKAKGITPREAVLDDSLKGTLEKVKGYDQVNKSKSVLKSNPRLASASDKMKKASEMKYDPRKRDELESTVTRAVLEAYGDL